MPFSAPQMRFQGLPARTGTLGTPGAIANLLRPGQEFAAGRATVEGAWDQPGVLK